MKKLSHKKLAEALLEALEGVDSSDQSTIIENFVVYLSSHGKLSQGEKILAAVEDSIREKDGYVSYEISTKNPLTKELRTELQKTLGEKAELTEVQDVDMLGGIIIKSKNTIYDASLKTALGQLKSNLNI